eukprot:1157803-Pelagomonas_calceolata.AAC.4
MFTARIKCSDWGGQGRQALEAGHLTQRSFHHNLIQQERWRLSVECWLAQLLTKQCHMALCP